MVATLVILAAGFGWAAEPSPFTIDAPPGWEDVTASRSAPDLVAAFKGPESSSFVLARVAASPLDNRGAIRAFLLDILTELNKKSGLGFAIKGSVEEASYDNGATAHFVRAELQGKPRLIVAVIDLNGAKFLGTLNSAVPDTLLPSIIGSLKDGSSASARPALVRQAQSLDGQLAFSLPEGVAARPLSEREKKLSFVLAVQGLGSELMVMKMVDDATPLKDQPQVVRGTVQTVEGVVAASISDPVLFETPPGPDLVYAWGRVKDPAGASQFAAGYLPWCYWGYSVLAKGPRAVDLVGETFKVLELGPGAQPKLVKETPEIPMPREFRLKRLGRRRLAAGAGAVILLALAALGRHRKVVGAR
ncbi:MAG: hypothetical protein HY077_12340 [Elusimicrobia bacterium]|nr:hypothetical protein [Elusimicrobiota bacterium]